MVELSGCRLVLVLCGFAVVVTAVGLMAGLINRGDSCPEATEPPGAQTTTTAAPQSTSTVEAPMEGPAGNAFLRESVYPLHYDLWLYPDFYHEGNTFFGKENVTIMVAEETDVIVIHAKMMSISNTMLWNSDGVEVELKGSPFMYEKNQYWVVECMDDLAVGEYVLHLEFTGSLVNGIVGYYKSNYTNAITGEKSWLATSKFQPTDSRKAFPNFDEPKFKANFSITLRHWQNFTAISNMPEMSTADEGAMWRETRFQTTPLMSSYLVCFIVFDFVHKNNTLANGKPHRVWAPSDRIDQVDFALGFGKKSQDFLEEELDMTFQLPKLDEVAVPDYPSGATEHWGIITYREARLLWDNDSGSQNNKQRVAAIIAHEAAHHFFGNAITCRSWDDIWLNEGFANFYEQKVLELVPEYEAADEFVINVLQPVMRDDALTDSRPVSQPVYHPDEANAAFSGLVYNKGASLLRMIEDFVGKEDFKTAIRAYLKKFEYSNVTTADLYNAIKDSTGIDIPTIMNPWTLQMGLPVINVTEAGSSQIKLTQARFLTDPQADPQIPASPYNYLWHIPIPYEAAGSITGRKWVNSTQEVTIEDPRTNSNDWLILNRHQTGFYRVNYSPELWSKLSQRLLDDPMSVDVKDRCMILSDAFSLAQAAQLPYTTALDMTQYLARETHYFPWASVTASLGYITEMLYNTGDFPLWRTYVQGLVRNIMIELGVRADGEFLQKQNRANNIIPLACDHGLEECVANVTMLFSKWIENDTLNAVEPDIRVAVYRYGMKAISQEEGVWEAVLHRFETEASPSERVNMMYTLAQTDKKYLVYRYLDYAWDNIQEQDFFTIISALGLNRDANIYAWNWLQERYEDLVERFSINNRFFGWMVADMISGFNTDFQLQEVESFFEKYPDAGAGLQARAEALSSIRSNIAWMKVNREPIIAWLRQRM